MTETTTAKALAAHWGTPVQVVRRWCRLHLLPAHRATTGWRIAAAARPPYRATAKSILALFVLRDQEGL